MRALTVLLAGLLPGMLLAQPAEANPTPSGTLKLLRKNKKGFEEYLWTKDSSVVIRIPAGMFQMGSTDSLSNGDQRPLHEVYLAEFYLDKYEVTNKQYRRFCDATGHGYPAQDPDLVGMPDHFLNYPNHPVGNVSWLDATEYCRWAGKGLPSEAQWEKAAKGLKMRRYPWGNDRLSTGDLANIPDRRMGSVYPGWGFCDVDDGYASTSPVGAFPTGASPYGIMDMEGNVGEWCLDWYADDYYRISSDTNPPGPSAGTLRVRRGTSFFSTQFPGPRCADRSGFHPDTRSATVGFRCALPPQGTGASRD